MAFHASTTARLRQCAKHQILIAFVFSACTPLNSLCIFEAPSSAWPINLTL